MRYSSLILWFGCALLTGVSMAHAQQGVPEDSTRENDAEEQPAVPTPEPPAEPVLPDTPEPEVPSGLGDEPDLPPGLGDEEPALPPGLGDDEPALPPGLGDEPSLPPGLGDDEPGLPAGLGDEETSDDVPSSYDTSIPFEWSAFLDLRSGLRLQKDPTQQRISMDETRFQLHAEKSWLPMSLGVVLTVDFILDRVLEQYEPDLEIGDGAIDLREAYAVASPLEWMDLKVGRQALTWGTGDLLFINDMFPKDWNAFLIGRDMEYLKAPSDAMRVSIFSPIVNVDLVYTPRFDADRFPDRRRLSSWDPSTQSIAGRGSELLVDQPDSLGDPEVSGRLHRRLGRSEIAAYGYRGNWKSPAGFDPATGAVTFPELSVYGASIRRPLFGGIAHTEVGYYDSRQNRSGSSPFVRNSESRGLVGFEREAMANLTVGMQYYVEYMRHHALYLLGQPRGIVTADQARHLVTLRLRYLAMDQKLEMGFFGYASPSDRDVALFPSVKYAISDEWKLTTGANVFWGTDDHTFFGQLEKNTNAYVGLRASWL